MGPGSPRALLLGMYLTMATVDTSDIGSFGIIHCGFANRKKQDVVIISNDFLLIVIINFQSFTGTTTHSCTAFSLKLNGLTKVRFTRFQI